MTSSSDATNFSLAERSGEGCRFIFAMSSFLLFSDLASAVLLRLEKKPGRRRCLARPLRFSKSLSVVFVLFFISFKDFFDSLEGFFSFDLEGDPKRSDPTRDH